MESLYLLLLLSLTIFDVEASGDICSSARCTRTGPDIRFPFGLKSHQHNQPSNCSLPGFDLSCKENNTVISFPSSKNLVIKSISYETKQLYLLDPKTCVHEVFLNLNLTSTPFQYYYKVENYTYLNCSSKLSPSFIPIPCLSGSDHHVYTVKDSQNVPDSCRVLRVVAIPFEYSPYLADNSFGLRLTWDLSGIEDSEIKGDVTKSSKSIYEKVIWISIIVVAVAFVIGLKIYSIKKLKAMRELLQNPNEAEKLHAETAKNISTTQSKC